MEVRSLVKLYGTALLEILIDVVHNALRVADDHGIRGNILVDERVRVSYRVVTNGNALENRAIHVGKVVSDLNATSGTKGVAVFTLNNAQVIAVRKNE